MNQVKKIAILLITLFTGLILHSQQIVEANMDGSRFKVGNEIKVTIDVTNNSSIGLHGIYFDMVYDSDVLEFVQAKEGSLLRRIFQDNQLLYAHSDEATSKAEGKHLIISYTLKGEEQETFREGGVIELYFKVISEGTEREPHYFDFKSCEIIDKQDSSIAGVTWKKSDPFYIIQPQNKYFIMIKKPYQNQVFYGDQAPVSLICSEGSYTVELTMENDGNLLDNYSTVVYDGRLADQELMIDAGFNQITACLKNSNEKILATDSLKIYRSQDDRFVKIKSPKDHALLNTDMAVIEVSSSYPVEVNGKYAINTGEMDTDSTLNSIYTRNVWLKKGFNQITAVAESPEGVKYTDTINIYYQKDSSIFSIVLPAANSTYKPSADTRLYISGEIDSQFKTTESASTGEPVENLVTLDVVYYPQNSTEQVRYLVNNQQARISDTDYRFDENHSRYIFYNDFPITLENLHNGELHIIAYKNRSGSQWEDKVTRIVYVDDNRLWIDLVQPNVFASDLLDSQAQIKKYNENNDLSTTSNGIVVQNQGELVLDNSTQTISNEGLSNVADVIETPFKDSYALVNQNNTIFIYKKAFGTTEWKIEVSYTGMFGYTLCYTDNGILVGGNNLTATDNSGLYLLKNNKLVNILPGYDPENPVESGTVQPMSHVQFIINRNSTIYLYGNFYQYLYQFNAYTLNEITSGENKGKLTTGALDKVYFKNIFNIRQFVLNDTADTAVLVTDTQQVYFYQQKEDQFEQMRIFNADSQDKETRYLDRIEEANLVLLGHYDSGEYDTWLILQDSGQQAYSVMENKANHGLTGKQISSFMDTITASTNTSAELMGVGFADNLFYFTYKDQGKYYLTKGLLFFENYYAESSTSDPEFTAGTDVLPAASLLTITQDRSLYYLQNKNLYHFFYQYPDQGTASFKYVNGQIDGIKAFSFEVDPVWSDAVVPDAITKSDFQNILDLLTDDSDKDFFNTMYTLVLPETITKNAFETVVLPSVTDTQDRTLLTLAYVLVENAYQLDSRINTLESEQLQTIFASIAYSTNIEYQLKPYRTQKNKNRVWALLTNIGSDLIDPFSAIELAFAVLKGSDITSGTSESDTVQIESARMGLMELLSLENANFTISSSYDPLSGRNSIYIEFNELQGIDHYLGFNILFRQSGTVSPSIHNLKVIKKIQPVICRTGSKTILPIRGYIYDRTVTQLTVNSDLVQLGRDGSFAHEFEITVPEDQQTESIHLRCVNALGVEAVLDFTVRLINSENGISSIEYQDENDLYTPLIPEDNSDFVITVHSDQLVVKGDFYGLIGSVAGYQLYGYEYPDGVKTPVLLRQGLFNNLVTNTDIIPVNLGTGYGGWTFMDESIPLIPGTQELRLYCENPGWKKAEYTVNDQYPRIEYEIDDADQKIRFHNQKIIELDPEETSSNGNPLLYELELDAFENIETDNNGNKTFLYQAEFEARGEIQSSDYFSSLNLISYQPGLTFSNDSQDYAVPVTTGNQFSFTFNVTMEDELAKTYELLVVPPDGNQASKLKTGLKVTVKKSFANTYYIPDLSRLHPDNWTPEQKENMEIPITFRMNRNDVPLNMRTKMVLTFNYDKENSLEGWVDNVGDMDSEDIYFQLEDDAGNPVNMTDIQIKNGINRVQWQLQYQDRENNNTIIMSSSGYTDPDMQDYLFEYNDNSEIADTVLQFSSAWNSDYYNNGDDGKKLPAMTITKDESTAIEIKLNEKPIISYPGGNSLETMDLATNTEFTKHILEGKNRMTVTYDQRDKDPITKTFDFLYDSKSPEVTIESWQYSPDMKSLRELTAFVKEANYKEAAILYGIDGREGTRLITKAPQIIIKGTDRCQLVWKDLLLEDIVPTETKPVTVIVTDKNSTSGSSTNQITGMQLLDQTGASSNEVKVDTLPLYNGTPVLANEAGWQTPPFQEHTKIAPEKYLKHVSVKELIEDRFVEDNKNYLIRNNETVLIEDFEDFDSNDWQVYSGNWQVVNGKYKATDEIRPAHAIHNRSNYKDFTCEADLTLSENGNGSLLFRVVTVNSDFMKGYMAVLDAEEKLVKLAKSTDASSDASPAILSTVSLPELAAGTYHLKVKAVGDNIKVYVDDMDAPKIDFQDTSAYKGGLIGVRLYRGEVEFDNIKVEGVKNDKIKILNPDFQDSDNFGYSVSISGDYAIVGSYWDDENGMSNTGSATVYKRTGDSWVQMGAKLIDSNPQENDSFGYSVSISGDYAIVGAINDDNGIGSATVFERKEDSWVQMGPKLLNQDPGGRFGSSVSIGNNYAIVGAAYDNGNGFDGSGSATVFKRDGDAWVQMGDKLFNPDPQSYDQFGTSVSISGDYAIVGSRYDSESGISYTGSATIFKREDDAWVQKGPKLVNADPQYDDAFGNSVAISGDYAIVGAYNDNENGNYDIGSATVFKREDENWVQMGDKLFNPDPQGGDFFGYSVSISGDYAIVGTRHDDENGFNYIGSATVYKREGENWVQKGPKLLNPDFQKSDYFGNSVSISGDYAIVGSYCDNENGISDTGSTTVFDLKTRDITSYYDHTLLPSDFKYLIFKIKKQGDITITDTSIATDISFIVEGLQKDDNGVITSIPSVGDDVSATLSLDADKYILLKSTDDYYYYIVDISHLQDKFNAQMDTYDAFFLGATGQIIDRGSLRIEYNPDWGVDFAPDDIYVIGRGNETLEEAIVYDLGYEDPAYDQASSEDIPVHPALAHTAESLSFTPDDILGEGQEIKKDSIINEQDNYGWDISISNNYAIVGVPFDDQFGTDRGSAIIYKKIKDGWVKTEVLKNEVDPSEDEGFGKGVTINDDYAIVGARGNDAVASNAGAVFIYKRDGESWKYVQKITDAINGCAEDNFGFKVDINGDYLVISALFKDFDQIQNDESGAVYIYKNDNGTWKKYGDTLWPIENGTNVGKHFGHSVSLSARYAVIGAKMTKNANDIEAGAVFIFENTGDHFELLQILRDENGESGDDFGASVDISGDFIITSSRYDNDKADNSGSVFIYKKTNQMWVQQKKLIPDDIQQNDSFGCDISINGDYAAIGARFQNDDQGAVYLYKRRGEDWVLINKIAKPGPLLNESPNFGNVVSLSENDLFIGAYLNTNINVQAGSAYIYPYYKSNLDQRSYSFWLRFEDEGINKEGYNPFYRRILTFSNQESEVCHLGYQGNTVNLLDSADASLMENGIKVADTMDTTQWHLITVNIDRESQKLELNINDKYTDIDLTAQQAELILNSDSALTFGAAADEMYNSGFYSISDARYAYRTLTDADIARLYNLKNQDSKYQLDEREYLFSSRTGDFSSEYGYLVPLGGTDYQTAEENADYTESSGHGSLKASSRHKNFLKLKDGKPYLILDGATDCKTSYLTTVSESEGLFTTYIPENKKSGIYHFGDKSSNYGLSQNRYYSISGKVLELEKNAVLTLDINGTKQNFNLKMGPFHFVYEKKDSLAPLNVDLYITTTGSLTLSNEKMALNEGNYVINKTLEQTAVKTGFPFDLSGTISFSYKPLNTNQWGYVNYETVLLDSDLLKIGTELNDQGDAVYYALLKEENSEFKKLETEIKVQQGWQHLQLSYDLNKKAIYFYINGSIAAKIENWTETFGLFGSLTGEPGSDDNLFIGCSLDQIRFAEGYIDNFLVSKYTYPVLYKNSDPYSIYYERDEDSQKEYVRAVKNNDVYINDAAVGKVDYQVTGLDQDVFYYGRAGSMNELFDMDISAYPAGRYRLTIDTTINGYRYQKITSFNIHNRPLFEVRESTPIVFNGAETDIQFKLNYDSSNRMDTETVRYAGAALRISYNSGVSEVRYIVENFYTDSGSDWLIGTGSGLVKDMLWTELDADSSGLLDLEFKDITPETRIDYEIKTFYFTGNEQDDLTYETLGAAIACDPVPIAHFSCVPDYYEVVNADGSRTSYDYKLIVDITGGQSSQTNEDDQQIFEQLMLHYEVTDRENRSRKDSGSYALNGNIIDLYYDDLFKNLGYGEYDCTLKLEYEGKIYLTKEDLDPLIWKEVEEKVAISERRLEIENFSLLYLDKVSNQAKFLLKYTGEDIGEIENTIEVIVNDEVYQTYNTNGPLPEMQNGSKIYEEIKIPKNISSVKITLTAGDFIRTRTIEVNNNPEAPEVVLINSVPALIRYSDVFFSWKGYYKEQYNSNIQYAYNLDESGWSSYSTAWKEVRFYNLEEGYHQFEVKALHNQMDSAVQRVSFLVDVNAPVFHADKIHIDEIKDSNGILYKINVRGDAGAITDTSLELVLVNGERAQRGTDGSFLISDIPVDIDGINPVTITAYDKAGNFTDYTLQVHNEITTILFPDEHHIRYSPMTVVGKISSLIDSKMEIYLKDPLCPESANQDYSGWKKAKINEDRTFFIENVFVNPGTAEKELVTRLQLVSVMGSGQVFTKEIVVKANDIILPLQMDLGTHAAQGENKETVVEINCTANIPSVSSWSIDFDGDGIYDQIDLTNNPVGPDAKSHLWQHKYSSLGLVKPRVRVITPDGNYFSVSDSIIIHETIKEASNKLIKKPITFSVIKVSDELFKVFVISENDQGDFLLGTYKVEETDEYISKYYKDVNITDYYQSMNLSDSTIFEDLLYLDPVQILAYSEKQLFIAFNHDGASFIYELIENDFGNYEVSANGAIPFDDEIKNITCDSNSLFVSFVTQDLFIKIKAGNIPDQISTADYEQVIMPALDELDREYLNTIYTFDSDNQLYQRDLLNELSDDDQEKIRQIMITSGYILLDNQVLDTDTIENFSPIVHDTIKIGANAALAKDSMGLLIADYYNQRVVRLSNALNVKEQFGSFGAGEKEFLKPGLIKSYENRIIVFDEARRDIQIFDQQYNPVCTLSYQDNPEYENYLEPDFFQDIQDIDIISKEDTGRLYYYALILSRSTGKLSLLRLPQWEDLRARVRNNKIVFLQDGELFTSKPEGGDLKKVLSTDSIPRIEGSINFPALSPDGRSLVFTSSKSLYNGIPDEDELDDVPNNLYLVDIETSRLTKIIPPGLSGYRFERPVFNSNGDKIIFSARIKGENWQIYIYNLDNDTVDQLFETDENARYPYYSPDDRFVVFNTDYDGDQDIQIIDTQNTSMRVKVTSNNARDSYPVWNTVYPFEISAEDLKIESKIAFVSERDFHKGIYYVYLSRKSEADIRVVKKSGEDIGNDPDSAAIEVTNEETEGDYPCFTGDGKALIFEYFDGTYEILKKYDFVENADNVKNNQPLVLTDMELPGNARKPAGMKNMIANFKAESVNGNDLALSWNRYTDNNIFYTVQFRENRQGAPYVEKLVYSQTGTLLKGLEMGMEYLVRVSIIENETEAASSQWKKVKMPDVVARPTVEIDEDNRYLVNLHAWKPEPDKKWKFTWLIDNQPFSADFSQDYSFEFATSGPKTIQLKTTDQGDTVTSYSDEVIIDIKSDIEPVIEYQIQESGKTLYLNASHSKGAKINFSETRWTVSGPKIDSDKGLFQESLSGPKGYVDISNFKYKVNITLYLSRYEVTGQNKTDVLYKSIVVDKNVDEIVPIIDIIVDEENEQQFLFTGDQSKGNINWNEARWTLYANGIVLKETIGVSNFNYLFGEKNSETVYSISLTVPSNIDEKTISVSRLVTVAAAPIDPKIQYKVLKLTNGEDLVVGAKVLLDCTQSRGTDIDYAAAKWYLPVAGDYNENQPTQFGPSAIYNLEGIEEDTVIDVALTLFRRSDGSAVTFTDKITIKPGEIPAGEVIINSTIEQTTTGKLLVLDAQDSTAPNIDWKNIEWLINESYVQKGPVAKYDIPVSGEEKVISYVCTLARYGMSPLIKRGTIDDIGKDRINPIISAGRLSMKNKGVYQLSVLSTEGVNIDWERTEWYIYDGNQVIQLRGAKVAYEFSVTEERENYPVMVNMYFKQNSKPFVAYKNIDVDKDELTPIITWDTEGEDENVVTFSAQTSRGSNIDWSQCKWTFGDASEVQYGPVAVHKFPLDSQNKKYRVSLTVMRKSVTGITETKTAFKNVNIGKDVIKPVIKANLQGDGFLVLSAEDSEGRGLLLNNSLWLFEGKGDNESVNMLTKGGIVSKTTINMNSSISATAGVKAGMNVKETEGVPYFAVYAEVTASLGASMTHEITNYNNYRDNTATYNSSNSHIGATCRKYVKEWDISTGLAKQKRFLWVSLFVYRMTADGGAEGQTITVNIDLNKAKSGVVYE